MTKFAVREWADVGGLEDGPIIQDYLIAYFDTASDAEKASAEWQKDCQDSTYYVREEEITEAEYAVFLKEQEYLNELPY